MLIDLLNNGALPRFIMEEAGDDGGAAGGEAAPAPADGDKARPAAVKQGGDPKAAAKASTKAAPAAKTGGAEQGGALDDDGGDDGGGEKEPGEDWRMRVSGGDAKFYKELQKYASETDLGKKMQDMRKQISKMPPSLSEGASEEEIAAYRKKVGLPETPDGYEKGFKLPEGTVIGEADKPLIGDFLTVAHSKNWNQDTVNEAVNWYYRTQQSTETMRAEQEKKDVGEAKSAYREEWGPDYDINRNMVNAWFSRQPDGVGDMLKNARGSDGKLLVNTPAFGKWLASYIRENEPSASVIQDAETSGQSIEQQMREIQDVIRDTPEKYQKDKRMQEKFARLSLAKRKMKAA